MRVGVCLFVAALAAQVLAWLGIMPQLPDELERKALAGAVILVTIGTYRRTEKHAIVPVREAFVNGAAYGATLSTAQNAASRRSELGRVLKMPTGAWLAGGAAHPPARPGPRHRSSTPRPRRR